MRVITEYMSTDYCCVGFFLRVLPMTKHPVNLFLALSIPVVSLRMVGGTELSCCQLKR